MGFAKYYEDDVDIWMERNKYNDPRMRKFSKSETGNSNRYFNRTIDHTMDKDLEYGKSLFIETKLNNEKRY